MKGTHKYLISFLLLLLFPLFAMAAPAPNSKAKEDKFTVVIDAGHGGKDTGAIDNNVKEKDINLGVALQLADLIKKKLKNVNVVLTRDNDTFLSLQERADKANKNKGNLFISIHTNSVDKTNKNRTSVAGASVYALGLHKDQNNMKVAQRENSVIELEKNYEEKYSGFDPNKDESYIIFEMAQKKNLSQSIKFANDAQKQLVNVAGRRDRGVHQAGFWVLWATSMPAVLVELDFICNPNSAKYMASEQGQKKLAEALFNAVKNYSESYSKGKSSAMVDGAPESYEAESLLAEASSAESESSEAVPARRREVTAAPSSAVVSTSRRAASASPRRRRSAAAKASSDQKDFETKTDIPLKSEKSRQAEEVLIASAPVEQAASVDSNNSKKSKNKKQDKKEKAEKDKVKNAFAGAGSPKSNPGHAASRRSIHASGKNRNVAMKTVYKIQLLASVDELKQNSPQFCGLGPISSFRENNLYKYTYGESENKSEIEALLREVQAVIPEAIVIQVTKLDDKARKS